MRSTCTESSMRSRRPTSLGCTRSPNVLRRKHCVTTTGRPGLPPSRSSFEGGSAFKKQGKWKGKLGYPQFKTKKKGLGSFRLSGRIVVSENEIKLPRLGRLRLKEREYLPAQGVQILSATVSEQAGHWYVSLQVEEDQTVPENTGPVVGIDLGIKSLATLSDGEVIPNPRYLKRRLKKLKRLQRMVSRRNERRQEPQESRPETGQTAQTDQAPTKQHPASGYHQAGENQVSAGHRRPERQWDAEESPYRTSDWGCGLLRV